MKRNFVIIWLIILLALPAIACDQSGRVTWSGTCRNNGVAESVTVIQYEDGTWSDGGYIASNSGCNITPGGRGWD